jgi:lipoprotein NlpI
MLERARLSLEASDRAAARRELTEALRLYPASPAVRNFLGVLEAGEGHYTAAEKRFREAVLRAPDYTDAHLNRAASTRRTGRDREPRPGLAAYQAILRTSGHRRL